jgi:catechol 2,3-dioxygenase-like lactoylglutathione lyase family enzyme
MDVRRLCWLGVRAHDYDGMLRLLRDVMGLRVEFEEESTVELSLPNDDRVQLFAPGHRYHDILGTEGTTLLPLFEVADAEAARAELEEAGFELLGPVERDERWAWINFRAPDGNIYGLGSRL